jgi:hypothetical protein
MSCWIDKCKQEINNIIQNILNQFFGIQIRICIVGYRDYCDGPKNFEVQGFTNSVSTCETFLGKLQASGGGDRSEDIAGAFELALKQKWKAKCRYAILITDAPCHGKKYHDGFGDDHPDGDKYGRSVEE